MCYSPERFTPVFRIIYFIYDSINGPTTKKRDVINPPKELGRILLLIFNNLQNCFFFSQLIHSKVVDTSIVFPHRLGPPYKRALRNLMADYLKKIIQDSGELWKIFLLDLAVAKELLLNDKRTVNPLLIPSGSLFISYKGWWGGGVIETRGVFNLAKTMVLVLHKELELDYKQSLIFLWRYPVICIILTFRSKRWISWAQPGSKTSPLGEETTLDQSTRSFTVVIG